MLVYISMSSATDAAGIRTLWTVVELFVRYIELIHNIIVLVRRKVWYQYTVIILA